MGWPGGDNAIIPVCFPASFRAKRLIHRFLLFSIGEFVKMKTKAPKAPKVKKISPTVQALALINAII